VHAKTKLFAGLGFTVKEIALQDKEQKKPEFAQSITGRVPSVQIVRDDGSFFWIAESSAIAEYLEEKFSPPKYPALFPQGIEQRARARQIMAWMRRCNLIAISLLDVLVICLRCEKKGQPAACSMRSPPLH
jgi:glutathione S-transferase